MSDDTTDNVSPEVAAKAAELVREKTDEEKHAAYMKEQAQKYRDAVRAHLRSDEKFAVCPRCGQRGWIVHPMMRFGEGQAILPLQPLPDMIAITCGSCGQIELLNAQIALAPFIAKERAEQKAASQEAKKSDDKEN